MSLIIDFDSISASAIITRAADENSAAWTELGSAAAAIDPDASVSPERIRLGWFRFLFLLRLLAHLRRRDGFGIEYTSESLERIQTFRRESQAIAQAATLAASFDEIELYRRLESRGWDLSKRRLTEPQLQNALAAARLANAANFSVPGAGKTTVTLALHLATLPEETSLLVVAPKNAFSAWDEVLQECMADPAPEVTRLVGGRAPIRSMLALAPAYAIIGYGQLVRVIDDVLNFLLSRRVHVVLDESHRIKAGQSSLQGNAALALSPFAARRDILTGTPMPNSNADLSPQFDFLWPGQGLGNRIRSTTQPRMVIGSLYVRTTKSQLGLPEPEVQYVAVDMSDQQRVLYGHLRSDLIRMTGRRPTSLAPGVNPSVMRLLQGAMDPQVAAQALLRSGLPPGDLRNLCSLILEESFAPRVHAVVEQVRGLARRGEKVVVWAPFLETIRRLVRELDDLGVVVIHGGIPAGDPESDDTREGALKRFHDDQQTQVLIANPAAGGEGISLHRVCHNAIYVGRTYNAAHYLQSRDRIHRLGLPHGVVTRITIYESRAPAGLGSIDMSVRRRLDLKVARMSRALDDPDLQQLALESASAEPYLDDGLTFEDLADLAQELAQGGSASH